jgi:riboflavin kinase / FMN adenylyltransferase
MRFRSPSFYDFYLMPHLIYSLKDLPSEFRGGAVAVGNFDGVHHGHEQLVRGLVQQAGGLGRPSIVFTFDPPPIALLIPSRPVSPPLTEMQRRAELLGGLGVDLVIAYPTDLQLLGLSAEQFFQQILVEALGAKAIVEGPNFHFGRDRQGDTRLLADLCKKAAVSLQIVEANTDSSGMISSTRIRQLIHDGRLAEANTLLTQPYMLRGRVTHGEGRGRKLGTPTANLTEIPVLVPKHGVYAGCVTLRNTQLAAAIHIGPNPTFQQANSKVEVHILDWTGELYDTHLACTILRELRPICRFDSAAQLQSQIALDLEQCRTIFRDYSAASN